MTRQQRIKDTTFTALDVVKGVALHRILEVTCKQLLVTPNQVRSKVRNRNIALARHIYCYIAYNGSTHYTLKEIGDEINMHHASVIHGKTKITDQIDMYKDVSDNVEMIKNKLTIFTSGADYDNKLLTKNHVGYYDSAQKMTGLVNWCNENDVVSKSKVTK